MVALDIDGTIVDAEGRIPDDLRAAVADAVASGALVVLSTGRGWHAVRDVFDALGLPPGPAVVSNGAVVVRYPPLRLDRVVTFDPRPALEHIAAEYPEYLLGVEVIGKGYLVNRPFPDGELLGDIVVADLERLAAEPATRVIVRDPNSTVDDFVELAEKLGLGGVTYAVGYTAWLDIAPDGVDKASGLAQVCADAGISAADVLAIGDGRNDIEMLRFAGRGVAVGDAPAVVQEAADHVTGTFADGGTTAELRRWFPAR
ncbi:HAD family hydrolase [Nigerium massiliense]|uniref:HAD family hydrolase n=1 Tax=Nigerium massiliense TaxID=1522317 RepID=UPI00058C1919|nr:HAD family hydrolase [Nigerium massiliense]